MLSRLPVSAIFFSMPWSMPTANAEDPYRSEGTSMRVSLRPFRTPPTLRFDLAPRRSPSACAEELLKIDIRRVPHAAQRVQDPRCARAEPVRADGTPAHDLQRSRLLLSSGSPSSASLSSASPTPEDPSPAAQDLTAESLDWSDRSRFFFQRLGACRRRTPTPRVDGRCRKTRRTRDPFFRRNQPSDSIRPSAFAVRMRRRISKNRSALGRESRLVSVPRRGQAVQLCQPAAA